MTIAFKAGPGYVTGSLCGPNADCDEGTPPGGPNSTLGSIGDRVWLDSNANGIQDPSEAGVEGVQVRLLSVAGDVLSNTVTNADGDYLFDNLVDGDYRVEFILPPGHTFTSPYAGTDTEVDSNANEVTGLTETITLEVGEHRRDVDAGLIWTTASVRIEKIGVFQPGSLDP
jgi:hypothetical protein